MTPSLVQGLRVGLLGGSFNPAHKGHIDITDAAHRALRLDRVWWLVTPGNPLKDPDEYQPLERRMAQAREVAGARPWLTVTDIEQRLGTRYTANTLGALTRRFARTQFVWIMGADNLASFHRWQNWKGIADMVPICVISRPGYDLAPLHSPAARALWRSKIPTRQAHALTRRSLPAWTFLPLVHNPVSATDLRLISAGV